MTYRVEISCFIEEILQSSLEIGSKAVGIDGDEALTLQRSKIN